MKLTVNNKEVTVDVPEDVPLLWVIREELKLTGTKFGCGKGLCGACTVHVNGQAVRACGYPVALAQGAQVHTIEHLGNGESEADLHPLQQHWIKNSVAQCGYCQSGQIMQALAMLQQKSAITEVDINNIMRGNICRCGSYVMLKKSIIDTAKAMGKWQDA